MYVSFTLYPYSENRHGHGVHPQDLRLHSIDFVETMINGRSGLLQTYSCSDQYSSEAFLKVSESWAVGTFIYVEPLTNNFTVPIVAA